jgi:hypothetical protein
MNETNQALNEQSYFPPILDELKIVCITDIDNNIYGPLSKLELQQCILEGRVDKDTRVNFKLGKDKHGTDTYNGWQRFEKSKWKSLLYSSMPEIIPNNSIRQITNVNVNATVNTLPANKQLPPVSKFTIRTYDKFHFIDDGNNTHGPFYGSALNSLLSQGLIHSSSMVYIENGKFEWKPLSTFR